MRAAAHLRGLALPLVVATAYRRSLGTGAAGDAPFDDGRGHKDAGALPLALIGELTYLPDSAKLQRGSQGEDAYFVSTYAVGVAGGCRTRAPRVLGGCRRLDRPRGCTTRPSATARPAPPAAAQTASVAGAKSASTRASTAAGS